MNNDINKKYSDEVIEIINSRNQFVERHYLSVRDSYNAHYEWPELDPLRHEITICITFGLCQAAITLTNHLLESLLKYALIINHGKSYKQSEDEIKGNVISAFMEKYDEAIRLYDNMNLDKTINKSCTLGLISKEQKKKLHVFRERFRNAYSHSDKSKTFGNSTVPVTGVRLDKEMIVQDESGNPEISKFLIGQGIIQFEFAQNEAAPYFLYIDDLVRQIWKKLFNKAE